MSNREAIQYVQMLALPIDMSQGTPILFLTAACSHVMAMAEEHCASVVGLVPEVPSAGEMSL